MRIPHSYQGGIFWECYESKVPATSGDSSGQAPNAKFIISLLKHLGAHGGWVRTNFISKVFKFIVYV